MAGLPIDRCLPTSRALERNRLCALEFLDLLYRLGQQVERAAGGANGCRRNMGITSRGAKTAMTEQNLDDTDVGARFEEMSRKGMPQRTYRDSLVRPAAAAALTHTWWMHSRVIGRIGGRPGKSQSFGRTTFQ